MLTFIDLCLIDRPQVWWAPHPISGCHLCAFVAENKEARPVYSDTPLYFACSMTDTAAPIVARPPPRVILCDTCQCRVTPLYDEAARRITEAFRRRRQPFSTRQQIIAQRIAFLRVLPTMEVYNLSGRDRWADFAPACIWCGVATSAVDTLRMVKRGQASANDPRALQPLPGGREHLIHMLPLHDRCWSETCRTIHTAHLAQCMASGALWLPLLPEVNRLVALFVCRLSAIGVEAAAVDHCDLWVSAEPSPPTAGVSSA